MDAMKCDICGGKLIMQAGGVSKCDSCGMEYSQERLREKVQEIRGTVKIEGSVQVEDVDFAIRAGKLEKYNGAAIDVVIPNTVREIGEEAFKHCSSLKSVIIPNSVTHIGYRAFYGCRSLTNLTIPNGVMQIEDNIIEGCANLQTLLVPVDMKIKFFVTGYEEASRYEIVIIPTDIQNADSRTLETIIHRLFGYSGSSDKFQLNGINIFELAQKRKIEEQRNREVARPTPQKSGCYIATAVYGSYDAPQVLILRRYRDNSLSKTALGRLFIRTYYFFSPSVARWMKGKERINKRVQRLLDFIVKRIYSA